MNTWQIIEESFQPQDNKNWEAVFSLGNGYMSVRGYPEEGAGSQPTLPHQYVAGVFGEHSRNHRTMVNLPSWKAFTLCLGGEMLRPEAARVSHYRRTLDMHSGELRRTFTWTSPAGKKTRLVFRALVSWDRRHVMAQRLALEPLNWSGECRLTQVMDGSGMTLKEALLCEWSAGDHGPHGIGFEARTQTTGLRVAICTQLAARGALRSWSIVQPRESCCERTTFFRVTRKRTFILERFAAVCTDFEASKGTTRAGREGPARRAARELKIAASLGWENLLAENAVAWGKKWRDCDVRLGGNDDAQRKLRFNLFALMQTCRGDDERLNLGAKLMTGEDYCGHYFWDTEIFSFPFFLYTQPATAEKLMAFRARSLDGARQKARYYGFKGAFYPWVSDPSGGENFWSYGKRPVQKLPKNDFGRTQLHITTAVTYALHHYFRVTGDGRFWFTRGAPVILETARFWVRRGEFRRGVFHIDDVTGPDEYHQGIDDNAYTNLTARWNIELALELLAGAAPAVRRRLLAAHRVTPAELARWKKAARAMLVPFNKRLGVIEQFPGFCRLKKFPFEKFSNDRVLYEQPDHGTVRGASRVAKQADTLQLFHLFPHTWPRDLMERCWSYYEPQTVHDSSLSFGAHAYIACLLGKIGAAWKFYRGVLDTDFTFHGNKYHVANGLHAANAGSAWFVAVLGFGGIYTDGRILECAPCLPKQLSAMEFTIYFQGRRCAFSIRQGHVKVVVDAGAPITLRIGETVHCVGTERTALTAEITKK